MLGDAPLAALTDGLVALTAPVREPAAFANHLALLQLDLADPQLRALAVAHARALRRGIRALLDAAVLAGELEPCDTRALADAVHATPERARRYRRVLMPAVLDIEQALLLLEIEPPFDQRDVQLARRRLAKVWHPDLAPPGRQFEHERHLKAINDAADQLISLAEGSRGGRVSRNAVKVCAAATRKARAEEGRRAYEAEQRAREPPPTGPSTTRSARAMPDHSVVHRYARCLSYPEWGVGSVTGIYFTGAGDDVQQWARVKFAPGVRTVPAGSLQFVDFSKPDPGAERVQRFMTAAQHAMAEGDYPLAAKRLIYRARRRADQRRGPAPHDAGLLAGRRAHRRRPRRARLGARRGRSPRAAPLRRAHLRGHGRDRPRRRGGRPRRRARPAGRRRVGARRAACACA